MDPHAPDPWAHAPPVSYGRSTRRDLGYTPPPSGSGLALVQVHYAFRHGERTPVRARLQRADPPVPTRWRFCRQGNRFRSAVLGALHGTSEVEQQQQQRRSIRAVEHLDDSGRPVPPSEDDW